VTLAYLKGKDAESEEAQEHANSSSLACTHKKQMCRFTWWKMNPWFSPGTLLRTLFGTV
jgi:hypothetical protein